MPRLEYYYQHSCQWVSTVNSESPQPRGRQRIAYFWHRKQVVCVWVGGCRTLINLHCSLAVWGQWKSLHPSTLLRSATVVFLCLQQWDWQLAQIMRSNQWYPSAWDIIWKWKFDRWTLFIYWSLITVNSPLWLGLTVRIWSVTVLWELSVTLFTGFVNQTIHICWWGRCSTWADWRRQSVCEEVSVQQSTQSAWCAPAVVSTAMI